LIVNHIINNVFLLGVNEINDLNKN